MRYLVLVLMLCGCAQAEIDIPTRMFLPTVTPPVCGASYWSNGSQVVDLFFDTYETILTYDVLYWDALIDDMEQTLALMNDLRVDSCAQYAHDLTTLAMAYTIEGLRSGQQSSLNASNAAWYAASRALSDLGLTPDSRMTAVLAGLPSNDATATALKDGL